MDLTALVEPDRVHKTVYTDQQIFDAEMERIWERIWVYCGHESQAKAIYVVRERMGFRDED